MARVTDAEWAAAASIRDLLRDFSRETERITRRHGLTADQYQLLLLLKVLPPRERTVGRLCGALLRRQSAVTQLARRAENVGLIERQLSKEDARVRYLDLTPEGERRLTATVSALGAERLRLLTMLGEIDAA
jgi:DNA-binding MarR family transcriptional regulator